MHLGQALHIGPATTEGGERRRDLGVPMEGIVITFWLVIRGNIMEATKLLKSQHVEVKALFVRYEKARDEKQKQAIFNEIGDSLAAHCTIEEEIFYPSIYVGPLKDALKEAVEEHLGAKRLIADLLAMKPKDAQFDAKMKVLKEEIEHHVKEEEGSLFPQVEKNFPPQELLEMGTQMKALFDRLQRVEPRRTVPGETTKAARLE